MAESLASKQSFSTHGDQGNGEGKRGLRNMMYPSRESTPMAYPPTRPYRPHSFDQLPIVLSNHEPISGLIHR